MPWTPCAGAPRSSPSRTPIFTHEDDALGPAGTTEWQAFVTDSEDNLLGLVGFERSAGSHRAENAEK